MRIPGDVQTLGAAIRWAREKKNMTLRAVATAIGVSAPFLSDVEHGRRRPSDLAALAKVLDVPALDLMRMKLNDDASEWLKRNPEMAELLRDLRPSRRCWCPWCRITAAGR